MNLHALARALVNTLVGSFILLGVLALSILIGWASVHENWIVLGTIAFLFVFIIGAAIGHMIHEVQEQERKHKEFLKWYSDLRNPSLYHEPHH